MINHRKHNHTNTKSARNHNHIKAEPVLKMQRVSCHTAYIKIGFPSPISTPCHITDYIIYKRKIPRISSFYFLEEIWKNYQKYRIDGVVEVRSH